MASVTAALTSTATDIAPAGTDNTSGAGLLNCAAAAGLRNFGDAPNTFGTTLAAGGARHIVVPGAPVLGADVDLESDGVPPPGRRATTPPWTTTRTA